MKLTKFFALALLMAFASNAFADAANVLVSFSTTADKYADGSPVADGEWYALCWSEGGNFGGLNLDCTPVRKGDLVCLMAPLAKGGKCPYTVFQIDSQSQKCKRTGVYTVVMLDTRGGADGNPSKTKPTKVYAAAKAKDYTAGSATAGAAAKEGASGSWAYTAIAEGDIPTPVIKGFQIVDAQVKIEVEGLVPDMRYTVRMGESIGKLDTYHGALQSGSDKATFYIDPKDAKFFQVVREPLNK